MDNQKKLSCQSQQVLNQLLSYKPDSIQDKMFGCLFGQLLGDALGSYLEFKKQVSEAELKAALQMPGGGCFKTAPGQITDDSEMAIELINGINEGFDQEKIAKGYDYWCNNGPFDIGRTTYQALSRPQHIQPQSIAQYQIKNSIERNSGSLSNGCLMRISPLAIYFASRNISDWTQIKETTLKDTQLTHSNTIVQQMVQIWVYMLTQIINIKNVDPTQEIVQILKDCDQIVLKSVPQIQKWYNTVNEPQFAKNIGHAKKSFKFGFQTLKKFNRSITFKSYMANVLKRGGDTDTNGCILGALLGGIVGFHSIYKENPHMVYTSLECQPNHQRDRYRPIAAVQLTLYMISYKEKAQPQIQTFNTKVTPQPSAEVMPILNKLLAVEPMSQKDRIFGCIFGQLLGDALGNHLEFQQNINQQMIHDAFQLPEGGKYKKASGAISSDSELAMELLNAIKDGFSQEKIAKGYDYWCMNTRIQPGRTIGNALGRSKNVIPQSYAQYQMSMALKLNQDSLSNGCLMRISPLAVFTALNPQLNEHGQLTNQDTQLTHSNAFAQEVVQVWVRLIADLININDNNLIPLIIEEDILMTGQKSDIIAQLDYKNRPKSLNTVESYLIEAYFVLKKFSISTTFKSFIKNILMQGGDTDTNACILGSLIGSVLGFRAIYNENPEWVHKLLNCVPINQDVKYRPLNAILDTFEMINLAPHKN